MKLFTVNHITCEGHSPLFAVSVALFHIFYQILFLGDGGTVSRAGSVSDQDTLCVEYGRLREVAKQINLRQHFGQNEGFLWSQDECVLGKIDLRKMWVVTCLAHHTKCLQI